MDDFHYTTGTTDSTSDDGVMSNMHVNSTQGLKVSTIKWKYEWKILKFRYEPLRKLIEEDFQIRQWQSFFHTMLNLQMRNTCGKIGKKKFIPTPCYYFFTILRFASLRTKHCIQVKSGAVIQSPKTLNISKPPCCSQGRSLNQTQEKIASSPMRDRQIKRILGSRSS